MRGSRPSATLSKGKLSFKRAARFSDEIVPCISLIEEGQLAATSPCTPACDFDPKASSPTVQDLLAACVDAIGAIYGELSRADQPERLEQSPANSLAAMEGIPFFWSEVKIDRHRIHVKVDKSNPRLDASADEWLQQTRSGNRR